MNMQNSSQELMMIDSRNNHAHQRQDFLSIFNLQLGNQESYFLEQLIENQMPMEKPNSPNQKQLSEYRGQEDYQVTNLITKLNIDDENLQDQAKKGLKIIRSDSFQKEAKKMTTCASRHQIQDKRSMLRRKQSGMEIITEFSNEKIPAEQEQSRIESCRKNRKILKKADKYIMKEKSFNRVEKLSFPKKIVQMFLNHYSEFLSPQETQICKYNQLLKQKLKRNKKNDYTFEKEVKLILGQAKGISQLEEFSNSRVSAVNRMTFRDIILSTMKEQVILRDKIAKNRRLYMIQLKVYALRCKSHRLSKKGTFK